jgi:hypothetical protein
VLAAVVCRKGTHMRTLCITLAFAACLVGVFTLAQATTSVGVVLSFMLFLMCMLLVSGSPDMNRTARARVRIKRRPE